MKRFIVTMLCAVAALAQEGTPVNVSQGPPIISYSMIMKYSGADLLSTCEARSQQGTATFIIAGTSPYELTSIDVSTNVGTVTTVSDHGLNIGDKIIVSGATVDTDLNGTYAIATVPTTKTFTITTVSVADGTYTEATLKFTTNAPRTTQAIWSIHKFTYVASKLTSSKWTNGTTAMNQVCDNSATLPVQ